MKKKYLFIVLILIIAAGLFFASFFLFNQPKSSSPDNLLGGDRDEHGCIGSAGYSWCEAKQKCLRIWEEPCEANGEICGIENCHGLEIVCGPNPAQICTEIYELGDRCRQYAECGFENGVCQQKESRQFTDCKNCVESCLEKYKEDQIKLFECESRCE
ncbi:hypothetical protein FJZ41_00615 [Candidatus Shapirobacteria bacterium]|nr:hypothetical protein [Candidatus Shapirobacteria bacterium]